MILLWMLPLILAVTFDKPVSFLNLALYIKVSIAHVCTPDDFNSTTKNGNNFLIKIGFLFKSTIFSCSLETGMKHCIAHCIGLIEPTDNSSIGSQTPCYYDGVTGKCVFSYFC